MISATTKRSELFTPFRYPGGKSALYRYLSEIIGLRNKGPVTYIEPFAGGAGAALALLFTERVERIVINDLDPAIYAAWKSMVGRPDDFRRLVNESELTISEWKRQREIYLSKDEDELRLGFAAFYLNRTSRSGVLNAGPIGGYDQTGNYKMDARFMRAALVGRLDRIALFRNRISVTKLDGLAAITSRAGDPASFFYVDPPYFEKGSRLYLNAFSTEDHQNLARELNERSSVDWLLTYDLVDEIRKLYTNRRSDELSLNYSMQKVGVARELIVYSDSIRLPSS